MASNKQAQAVIGFGLLILAAHTVPAQGNWFERFIPQGQTYVVSDHDRDVAFVLAGYVYEARRFCDVRRGDRMVFFNGRLGMDYRVSLYNLETNQRCDALLR